MSKHLGCYGAFKHRIHDFGIKWQSQDGIESFLRILKDENRDVGGWIKTCLNKFDRSYATLIKFAFISGLRKSEALQAFNLTVKLNADGKLCEFYNSELETLEFYRHPKTFLRRGKNVYFSFIPPAFMQEIGKCRPVSNSGLKRRLIALGLPCRLQDLRHYHATFMVKHGLLREEADLLQGRVNRTVFMRHYYTPSMQELKHRVKENVEEMLAIAEESS